MNSLTELNSYVNSLTFEYTDLRYARVIFDRDLADNQTKVVNEGETFPLSIGIEITDVVNYSISQPTLTIDISSSYDDGVRVEWDSLPDGVVVTPDGSGTYVFSGINSSAIWDQVKLANIVLPTNVPDAFYGNWTYSVSIDYIDGNLGAQSKDYTVAVTVLDVTQMSTPVGFVYDPSSTGKIFFTPQLAEYLDTDYPGATWTITATVSSGLSVTSFSSTYSSGGTFTYNSGTKGFTIVGTRAQVNSHLSNLYITANAVEIDFVIYYILSNNQDSSNDSKNQSMTNQNIQYFSNLSESTFYYTEDTEAEITGYPQITDITYSGSGSYTVEIYPSTTSYIYTLGSSGTGGSSSFDSGTKVLTITGTKEQVNSHLLNVSIQTESDVATTFQLFYELSTPLGAQSIKIMTLICGSNDNEVSNISVTRSYVGNTGNILFPSSIPQITDLDSTGTDTYSITFTTTLGVFTDNDIDYSSTYSYSGTRAQVNAKYSLIKFYPNKGVSSNGVVNYTQIKNSATQVSTSFALNGTAGSYSDARTVNFSSTQTFTPTITDVLYARYAIYIVGGGGGGGYQGGGGGGGGEGLYYYNQSFTLTTYTATVGVGGLGGNGTSGRTNGLDGSNSTFASFTARGGKGGVYGISGGTGGASGNGHPGGAGAQSGGIFYGGGGGGNGTGFYNTSTGEGEAATPSGSPQGGNGGPDLWFYTYKDGTTTGPSGDYSGQGGGGGGYNTGGATRDGGGEGGDLNAAGENGKPGTGVITPQYAGNGGGGGGYSVYLNGGNGADGYITLDIYY